MFTFSCSSRIEGTKKSKSKITAANLKPVGIQHNQLLAKTYAHLKKSKNLKKSEAHLKSFFVKDVTSNKHYTEKSRQNAVKCIRNNLHFANPKFVKSTVASANTSEAIDTLSAKVKSYLAQLKKIVTRAEKSNVSNKISTFENKINSNTSLSKKQRVILYSATETMKYSYKYWTKNMKKWVNIMKNKSKCSTTIKKRNNSSQIRKVKTGNGPAQPSEKSAAGIAEDIAVADGVGAASGAAYAFVFNAVPGGGQVAYITTIAESSAAASTGTMLYDANYKLKSWL